MWFAQSGRRVWWIGAERNRPSLTRARNIISDTESFLT
jgi:hypothetical protein